MTTDADVKTCMDCEESDVEICSHAGICQVGLILLLRSTLHCFTCREISKALNLEPYNTSQIICLVYCYNRVAFKPLQFISESFLPQRGDFTLGVRSFHSLPRHLSYDEQFKQELKLLVKQRRVTQS